MNKQIFPKSKYSSYSGKKLLKTLFKDFAKIFIPFAVIIPSVIYFNDVKVKINDVPAEPLDGAITFLFIIIGFWMFFTLFAFMIFSISNSNDPK